MTTILCSLTLYIINMLDKIKLIIKGYREIFKIISFPNGFIVNIVIKNNKIFFPCETHKVALPEVIYF